MSYYFLMKSNAKEIYLHSQRNVNCKQKDIDGMNKSGVSSNFCAIKIECD